MSSFDKDEKAIDITTKYTELLITLASGTIVACIAFFEDISKVPGINLQNVKCALLLMAISIVAGLFTLGRIIGVLQFGKKPEILTPYERWIRVFSFIQLFTYGLGMLLIWLGIPIGTPEQLLFYVIWLTVG